MNPLFHFLITIPFCYIIYPFIGPVNTALVFFGGWIFDFDHYLYCIFKHKNFSVIDCWRFHSPFAKEKDLLHVFHTIEFYVLILIISFYIEAIGFLFIGLIYHQLFDIIKLIYLKIKKEPRANNCRAASLIMWLKRHY